MTVRARARRPRNWIGLSSDSKPAGDTGSCFYETDTSTFFLYTGSAWVETDWTRFPE